MNEFEDKNLKKLVQKSTQTFPERNPAEWTRIERKITKNAPFWTNFKLWVPTVVALMLGLYLTTTYRPSHPSISEEELAAYLFNGSTEEVADIEGEDYLLLIQ